MKSCKRFLLLAVMLGLICAVCGALGEQARVVTPGGALNVRKSADEKSKLVETVPNRAMVEVEETGETWSKITYKKKTGYVKTDFLKLPQNMIGKAIYPDEGTLLIRREESPDAEIVCPVGYDEAVTVEAVGGDWAKVRLSEAEGYVEIRLLSYQYEEPQGDVGWIRQAAVIAEDCALHRSQDASSPVLGEMKPGDQVTVTVIEKDVCLLLTENGCGYAPKSAVAIQGMPDTAAFDAEDVISRADALSRAETALKKKFKSFSKERLYGVAGQADNGENPASDAYAYTCAYFNDQDQLLYAAVVDARSGEVYFMGEYSGFAVLGKTLDLLPDGEAELKLSAETLAVGEVLDITVRAWTANQVQYTLYKDGVQAAKTEPGQHFTASFRPREAGDYRLSVTVTDEAGKQVTKTGAFTVDPSLSPEDGLADIYSQKDGWWADKKYRHSNLGKSGCAIFALSHALYRFGYDGDAILPQNLAEKYAYCLIPGEGTSNELLINTAAKDFGFKTQKNLITEKKTIEELLNEGTLFSFSIVKGHIAMVSGISEDGSMIRVVDSAPGATMERIKGESPYFEIVSGVYRAALSLDDLPGIRWYLDTGEYGGMEYWLPMDYVAKRGVRLMQPVGEQ